MSINPILNKNLLLNLNGKNIYINTDERLSTNTNVIADENLYVNTNNLNVKASQDNYTSKNDSENINGSVSFTMYGGGGGTAGLGYGKSDFSSDSFLNNNSQLSGNNVNINVTNDASFVGANVRANDTLNLNVGNNLVLESLRDEYSSNSKGFNVNVGGSSTSVNGGFTMSNGVSQNKQTVLSSITGDKVNVNVGNNTHLKGSLLASGNYDEKGIFQDNKNLNFITNTLTFGNSSNSSYSSSKSLGANVNYNLENKKVENTLEKPQQKGVSSVGYQAENSLSANASKTLATLGQGNITVKDVENSDELDRLNRDTTAVNKDLYSSSTGTKVDATLDTRLLTEDGRNQIKDDMYTASAILKSIEQISSNDKISVLDFFDETQQNVDVYNAMKRKIASDENFASQLQDPNLDPLAKQNMLQEIALTVMKELGYVSNDVKLIYTDETGVNKVQVKGFYDPNTQTSYVNDKYNSSTSELVSSTGHEIMHDVDKQNNIFVSNDKDQNIYATNFGNNLAYYTNGALYIVNGGNLASINNHNNGLVTQYPSVFNTNNVLTGNNKEFANINKSGGDDLPVIPIAILGVTAFQSYLNAPTDKNDVYTGIAGEIDKNMNQPMIKVINKSGEVINLFGNDLNTLYVKRDDISQDISTAYNNMPERYRFWTIDTAMTIFEKGITAPFSPVFSVGYDYYSGENFITHPTSIPGALGYINNKMYEKENNDGK